MMELTRRSLFKGVAALIGGAALEPLIVEPRRKLWPGWGAAQPTVKMAELPVRYLIVGESQLPIGYCSGDPFTTSYSWSISTANNHAEMERIVKQMYDPLTTHVYVQALNSSNYTLIQHG